MENLKICDINNFNYEANKHVWYILHDMDMTFIPVYLPYFLFFYWSGRRHPASGCSRSESNFYYWNVAKRSEIVKVWWATLSFIFFLFIYVYVCLLKYSNFVINQCSNWISFYFKSLHLAIRHYKKIIFILRVLFLL